MFFSPRISAVCVSFYRMKAKTLFPPKDVEKVALKTFGRVKFDAIVVSFREHAGMDGEIASEAMEHVLRANGLCPSLAELADMKKSINTRGGSIDLQYFLSMALECESITSTSGMSELVEFFSVYDPSNTGLVPIGIFTKLMMNCGERFSEKELNEVISAFESRSNEGLIDYRAFITTITGT
jgi:Ca2+-binding EF-hand superfamily protein